MTTPTTITVGTGTCGVSAGANKVIEKLQSVLDTKNLKHAALAETGCMGMCYAEVLVEIKNGDGIKYVYGNITPERVERLIDDHIVAGKPIDEWLVLKEDKSKSLLAGIEKGFIKKQERIVLRNCGQIDPMSIDDYVAAGGYTALDKALKTMSRENLVQEILDSGLRGRGGAGFLTGMKWKFAHDAPGAEKYVICNADEGDPGAFMDRSVLEGDPHSVLEGMLLCGYAIGAHAGYIYCRAEYPRAIVRLNKAIADATERGFLGENIGGTDYSFTLRIKEGAGAFVCGEETALIASIEGERGTPRIRPPYPAAKGVWGKPTNINNVETLANIAWIVNHGAEAYAALGTKDSKGTKVFAMAGKVKRSGLVEVPMGITINEIVFDVCGGIVDDKKFKAVQMGGPSGGCIPASLGDTPIDYQRINETGAIMGSGGMVVVDEDTCMVELARFFLEFTQKESCGRCTSCRVGTLRMLEILERIVAGDGKEGDIEELQSLSTQIKSTSQCGLGQTAPNPVLTTIHYFRDEYEAHIKDKRCPAHSCPLLVDYVIKEDLCTGCQACVKVCEANAITGDRNVPHVIDPDTCIRCGKCITVCTFDAIYKD
ncbi:MAG: NADH-quinone oxidoreductase subunit NuoF [Deltaproteobacteria bacterium]|nr:NADH-quinone oxidoreductase subunit NuoF [Deltaproteobacteria bacterium]